MQKAGLLAHTVTAGCSGEDPGVSKKAMFKYVSGYRRKSFFVRLKEGLGNQLGMIAFRLKARGIIF